MRSWRSSGLRIVSLLALGTLPARVFGSQILQTSGFSTCLDNSTFIVNNVDIQYNNDNQTVTFNVAGISSASMNVTASLNVTAYGKSVYSNSFNPCDATTFISQLCPVPAGTFSASGVQAIPAQYASLVPAIAFQVPDIAAQATLELKALDSGKDVACLTSSVTNGKTFSVPAVSYIAVGVAGVALIMTGVSAVAAAVAGGGSTAAGSGSGALGTVSPSFLEVFTWFQGIAMNGMLSVNYPPIYRSFSKNFAFSTGLVAWTPLQRSIDSFRGITGGNLTNNNVDYLQNATLIYNSGSSSTSIAAARRALADLVVRDLTTSFKTSAPSATPSSTAGQIAVKVTGIGAYVESLAVPQANTFMTVLLVVAAIVAAIVVGVLLFKLILEFWALFGSFPKSLIGFRKHYWGTMARSIVNLIMILYGIWVLYCIYQFTHGDSWAAKALAGITLAAFTGILAYFTFKIWQAARRSKEAEGDVSLLYEDKSIWIKYSLFYDCYKKSFWWTFVPAIVYMFAKGCVVAGADGHGLAQTIAQLVIEGLMLILLVFTRPYERKSGNVINIFIQVVRALSVICILVFVEELGVAQTTQTITGVVLIVVQSVLTGVLAILIAVNAIIICCKENPHRKRRKEAEKLNRDVDDLTPLDARDSLLTGKKSQIFSTMTSEVSYASEPKVPILSKQDSISSFNSYANMPMNPVLAKQDSFSSFNSYANIPANRYGNAPAPPMYSGPYRPYRPTQSRDGLMKDAEPVASLPRISPPPRQPSLPINLDGYGGYRGRAF